MGSAHINRIEIGAAIAHGLYNQFKDDPGTAEISFAVYVLFIGVAMAITVSLFALHLFLWLSCNVYEPIRLSLFLLAS